MNKINFQNGTLISPAKVEVDGVVYEVIPAQIDGTTPINASNLNQLQTNIENAINGVIENVNALRAYSTNEKVVGTWVDNKPLYEKTLFANKVSGTDLVIPIASNIDVSFVVSGSLNCIADEGNRYSLDRYEDGGIFTRHEIVDGEFVYKSSTGNYTNGVVMATIRYTKTTD